MSLTNIEQLLRQRIGLHTESVGRSAISSAVGRRMASLDLGSVNDYYRHLTAYAEELDQLIETVVIPETWFFRDKRPFDVLKQFAGQRRSAAPNQCLRALSVPCSTGEEPYSIAMTLLEAGIAPERIRVDAVDISRRALDFARAGNYGNHSFRGDQNAAVLDRYFRRDGARFQISEAVANLVNYIHGNLADAAFQGTGPGYDVIFCRNLMIYFDDQAKRLAYRTLQRLLAEHGLLFVGHAECGTVPLELFHNAGQAYGFAFRSGAMKPKSEPGAPGSARKLTPARRHAPSRRHPPRPVRPAPTSAQPDGDPLELARQLADLGRYQESAGICEANLSHPTRQAEAYFLLGTVRMAQQELESAEQALRRALYLEPKHYECLVQMALLLQQRGDHEASKRMRRRAERAAPAKLER